MSQRLFPPRCPLENIFMAPEIISKVPDDIFKVVGVRFRSFPRTRCIDRQEY